SGDAGSCEGLCLTFTSGVDLSICSRPCVFGGASDTSPACGGPEKGLCAFHRSSFGAGDLGYCTLPCSAYAHSQTPRYRCFPVPLLPPMSGKGYCFAATPCSNGDCGDGGSGLVCTPTPVGPLCLDPSFGLPDGGFGDAGPDDAGDAGLHDADIDGPHDGGPI